MRVLSRAAVGTVAVVWALAEPAASPFRRVPIPPRYPCRRPDLVEGDTITVSVNAANATDCTVNACSIYTLSAHGNPDRTQDTKTSVVFKK